ncbi:MAG: hypothetical protein IPH72_31830 [Sandaracinaceae bacterium]|nr:hypothetical protein [Sandaracinaceae bacterium]
MTPKYPERQKQRRAAAHPFFSPDAPPCALGELALVAVRTETHGPSLWHLRWGGRDTKRPDEGAALLIGAAEQGLRAAARSALKALPIAARADVVLRPTEAWAELVFDAGDVPIYTLDGRSFDLAFWMAVTSLALDLPVPHDIVASAVVSADGRLTGVEGVALKARFLASTVPCVGRFLVADADADAARAAVLGCDRPGPPLEIVSAPDVHAALLKVFGENYEAEVARRVEADDLGRVVDQSQRLFHAVVGGGAMSISWRGVEMLAAAIETRFSREPSGDHHAADAVWARLIARRHQGIAPHRSPPPASADAHHPRGLRRRLHAQRIQHARDAGDAELLEASLDAALREVPVVGDETTEDIHLLGALGRGLAAMGRLDEAARHLTRACELADALGEPAARARSLCELLRVSGLLGRADEVDALASRWVERDLSAMPVNDQGRAYLLLAQVHASVHLSRWAGAQERLHVIARGWQFAPGSADVRASAYRRLLQCLAAEGAVDHEAFDNGIAGFDQLDPTGASPLVTPFRCMAQLDAALIRDDQEAASAMAAAGAEDGVWATEYGWARRSFKGPEGGFPAHFAKAFGY